MARGEPKTTPKPSSTAWHANNSRASNARTLISTGMWSHGLLNCSMPPDILYIGISAYRHIGAPAKDLAAENVPSSIRAVVPKSSMSTDSCICAAAGEGRGRAGYAGITPVLVENGHP